MVLVDRNAVIFKIKINVGEHFGVERDAYWVELREPTTEETIMTAKTTDKGTQDQQKVFDLIPQCIMSHNFESEPGKLMTKNDVWSECMRRGACSTDIVEAWSNNIPLAKKKVKS